MIPKHANPTTVVTAGMRIAAAHDNAAAAVNITASVVGRMFRPLGAASRGARASIDVLNARCLSGRWHDLRVTYFWALILTLVVEVPIYTGLLSKAGLFRPIRATVVGSGVNLVTHPLAWLVISLAGHDYWPVFWTTECAVWLTEAGLLYAVARQRLRLLAVIALTANTASLLTGLTVNVVTQLQR